MKDEIILNFQRNLYKKITKSADLAYYKENIYNFIPQDSKFPFIYIGNYIVSDWSNKTMFGLKIIFFILIFSKMQTSEEIIKLSNLLSEVIHDTKLEISRKYIANIKFITSKLEQTNQRAIYKNTLKFQANLEEI